MKKEADGKLQTESLCPRCKTGRDSLMLYEHSEECPYIECWKEGECPFYRPLEKSSRPCISEGNENDDIKQTETSLL